jgi:uncharacterized membrane protein
VFVFALIFSLKRQGFTQSFIFFLPAVVWGLFLEYATQEVFHRYFYGGGFLVYVANVPLCISLAWAALMYISYCFITQKFQLKNSIVVAVAASIPLLLLDVIILEPTAKFFGFWVWTPQGLWFGSSIGNFYGWFWVIVLYLSFYHFLRWKTDNWRKALLLNLGLIALRVIILIALLQLYKIAFGNF